MHDKSTNCNRLKVKSWKQIFFIKKFRPTLYLDSKSLSGWRFDLFKLVLWVLYLNLIDRIRKYPFTHTLIWHGNRNHKKVFILLYLKWKKTNFVNLALRNRIYKKILNLRSLNFKKQALKFKKIGNLRGLKFNKFWSSRALKLKEIEV